MPTPNQLHSNGKNHGHFEEEPIKRAGPTTDLGRTAKRGWPEALVSDEALAGTGKHST